MRHGLYHTQENQRKDLLLCRTEDMEGRQVTQGVAEVPGNH